LVKGLNVLILLSRRTSGEANEMPLCSSTRV